MISKVWALYAVCTGMLFFWIALPKADALSGQVLFVVGNTTLNAGDAAVRNRLQALGLAVTTVDDGLSQAGDATGKQMVVISSTVNSADVNTKYRNTAVPVLTWEPRILDDLGMTGLTLGTDYSTTAGQTQIVMAATIHQLAAGLSGTVSVSTSVQSVAWGKPGTNAIKIAQVVGDPAKASIFAYNTGASMVNLTAPARRTALFPSDNTAVSFTVNGWKLFDAAVQWTFAGTPLPGTSIKYNFQPSTSAIPSGYTPDIGQAYNGTRGWVMQNSLQNPSAIPLDMRAYTRDRKVAGVDQRLNTIIHLQPTGAAPGAWEYNLSNGPYTVTASIGDPSYINSKHRINMEGGIAINNFIPNSSNKFFSISHLVYVNDGKLTLDAIGGTNTKLNYVEISNASAAASRPAVTTTNPKNGATNVPITSAITADVHIPTSNAGVNQNTLSSSTVKLTRLSNNTQVAANFNTSGGGDVIVVQPTAPGLAPLTEYFFQVTSGVKDLAGAAFIPYAIRFTTGDKTTTGPTPVKFEKIALSATAGKTFTSVVIGPDQKLYAAVINGEIMRFPINTTNGPLKGTLGTGQSLQSLRTANSGDRMLIGLAFDPSSTPTNLILWVSHSAFVFSNGPDWTGKITRLSGPNLSTVRDYVVNLPRSVRDHVTNSLSFGPDGKLYINQGSNTAMGAPDNAWGNRPERVLSAAMLQATLSRITAPPLNVKSEEGGTYNPFATNAPVIIYASGIRNAYDHVWHSNGRLYVPTNGSASGGNTPATPSSLPGSCANRIDGNYTSPQVPSITNVTATQNDYLFRVVQNGYYGHPNPKRCEWVMNGGDPTTGTDPAQVTQYPDGTQPDRNWRRFAYDFGQHFSPNGIIEYKNNAFGGALKGKLLVVRYSSGDDIIVLTVDAQANIASSQTGIQGFTGFKDPLDIIENTANGHLYVTEYGGQKITLLRPL